MVYHRANLAEVRDDKVSFGFPEGGARLLNKNQSGRTPAYVSSLPAIKRWPGEGRGDPQAGISPARNLRRPATVLWKVRAAGGGGARTGYGGQRGQIVRLLDQGLRSRPTRGTVMIPARTIPHPDAPQMA